MLANIVHLNKLTDSIQHVSDVSYLEVGLAITDTYLKNEKLLLRHPIDPYISIYRGKKVVGEEDISTGGR